LGRIDKQNVYQKGVLLEYLSLPSDLRWRGEPHLNSKRTLKEGTMKWGELEAEYIVVPGNPFGESEKSFLTDKGYILPQCSLLKVSTKQQAWTRMYISYFESFPCGDIANLSAENIESFMQSSIDDMMFE
jgi:hypothetical protein